MLFMRCEKLKILDEVISRMEPMGMGAGNFGKGGVVDYGISDHGFKFYNKANRRSARLAVGMQHDTIVMEFNSLNEDIPAIIKVVDFDDYLEAAAAMVNWFVVEDGDMFTCRKNGPLPAFHVCRENGNTKLGKAE